MCVTSVAPACRDEGYRVSFVPAPYPATASPALLLLLCLCSSCILCHSVWHITIARQMNLTFFYVCPLQAPSRNLVAAPAMPQPPRYVRIAATLWHRARSPAGLITSDTARRIVSIRITRICSHRRRSR